MHRSGQRGDQADMSTGRRIVFGLLILFFLFLLITNPTGAAAAMSAVFAAIGTFFNALVTFISSF